MAYFEAQFTYGLHGWGSEDFKIVTIVMHSKPLLFQKVHGMGPLIYQKALQHVAAYSQMTILPIPCSCTSQELGEAACLEEMGYYEFLEQHWCSRLNPNLGLKQFQSQRCSEHSMASTWHSFL